MNFSFQGLLRIMFGETRFETMTWDRTLNEDSDRGSDRSSDKSSDIIEISGLWIKLKI